jgi:hypothetical protein
MDCSENHGGVQLLDFDDHVLSQILQVLGSADLARAAVSCSRMYRLAQPLFVERLQREPEGWRHALSWEACGGKASSYLGWRLSW